MLGFLDVALPSFGCPCLCATWVCSGAVYIYITMSAVSLGLDAGDSCGFRWLSLLLVVVMFFGRGGCEAARSRVSVMAAAAPTDSWLPLPRFDFSSLKPRSYTPAGTRIAMEDVNLTMGWGVLSAFSCPMLVNVSRLI